MVSNPKDEKKNKRTDSPPKENSSFFKKTGAYSTYVAFLYALATIALIAAVVFIQYKSPYVSLILGGALSGFFGVFAVLVQDLQERKRLPKVIMTSAIAADVRSSRDGRRIFPLFLKNEGYEPGREILIFLKIAAKRGSFKLDPDSWIEAPYVSDEERNYKIYQNRILDIIYPRNAEQPLMGRLLITPQNNGEYDVEITADIYEQRGMTKITCLFIGNKDLGETITCFGPEFHAYY